MNELSKAQRLRGKNVVIIGGSRGLGKTIVAATHAEGARVLAVARREQSLRQLAAEIPGVRVLALDAADEGATAQVFETLLPDILVVCAGALPHMAPLVEQSWEQFSRNWNSDVKMSLLFSQAALTTPLPAGTTIMLISSGAAIGGRRFQVATPARSARRCFSRIMPRRNPLACNSVCSFSRLLRGASCPKLSWGKRLLKRMLPLSVFHLPILSKIWEQR